MWWIVRGGGGFGGGLTGLLGVLRGPSGVFVHRWDDVGWWVGGLCGGLLSVCWVGAFGEGFGWEGVVAGFIGGFVLPGSILCGASGRWPMRAFPGRLRQPSRDQA